MESVNRSDYAIIDKLAQYDITHFGERGDEMTGEKNETERREDVIRGILHKLDQDELVELLSRGLKKLGQLIQPL